LIALIVPLVLTSACEHGITLTGTVEVAAALTDGLTDAQPGVVVIVTSVPKTSVPTYRLAVLCEPSSNDVVLPWSHDGFGCAKEGTVTARLYTADAGEIDATCAIATELGGAPASAALLAEASATVFEGNSDSSGCSDGNDTLTLRLQP
jgi:hypothetical protein